MPQCSNPACNNPLKTGRKFCSTKCSAQYREAKKRGDYDPDIQSLPDNMVKRMTATLGEETTSFVLNEMAMVLEDETIPLPSGERTLGDWVLSFDGEKEYRPGDNLSFDKIDMMLRSGPVRFALEMKRSMVVRNFSEGRFTVESPDKELQEVAMQALKLILPRMMNEITWSAFAYGASFQEQVWENKTKYELGMSNSRNATQYFAVPAVPKSCNPSTIDSIRRTGKYRFNGFIQNTSSITTGNLDAKNLLGHQIEVDADSALVVPLYGRFRNLFGETFLKSLYPIWLWYELTLRTMARYMERMAMPVAKGKAPQKKMIKVEGKTAPVRAIDMMLSVAANVAKSNAVVIPSDYDENNNAMYELEYLSSPERGQEFIKALEFFSTEMIKAAIIADRSVSQSGGVGSYNIGGVHAQSTAISNLLLELDFLYFLNKYFMPGFSVYNRGVNGPPIWIKTQASDEKERELLKSLVSIAGNSPGGQEFFNMIDFRTMAETSNIPVLSEEEVEEAKQKLLDESLKKQEEQQKLMMKYEKNKLGNDQAGGIPAKDKQDKVDEGEAVKQEQSVIGFLMEDGSTVPWMLGPGEIELMRQHGLIDEEVAYRLFNPFHDRSSGRFSSRRGGGGGSGTDDTKQRTVEKAKRTGGIVRTTGKVLGIAGLGLVGFAILGAAAGSGREDPLAAREEAMAKDAAKKQAELDSLTENWPKFADPVSGANFMSGQLESMGFDVGDISAIKVSGELPSGIAGQWNPDTNTLLINPAMAELVASGDPAALHVLTHEIAHSGQEFVGADPNWGNNSEMVGGDDQLNRFSQMFEGQNDLVTALAMSDAYRRPLSNDETVGLSNQVQRLRANIRSAESGVTIISDSDGQTKAIGYQDQAETWAAIATVGAQQTGQTPREYLAEKHSYGFSQNESHQVLVDIFPDEMKSNGYYNDSSGSPERKWPSQTEIRQWMGNHGYVDPKLAYKQMLEEAAR